MPVRVVFDAERCAAKVTGAWQKSLFTLTSQVMQDTNQYVKRDTGTLEMSSVAQTQIGTGVITWNTPYAKRQYWEIQTSLTPGRTWKWCETAKRRHKDTWGRIAERLLRNNL